MARGLGLTAYRALSWRLPQEDAAPPLPRPEGPLLWAHAASADRYLALCDLTARVRSLRPGLNLLVTLARDAAETLPTGPGIATQRIAGDHPESVRRFLDHWRPDVGIWAGGALQPNLITAAADRAVPLILADLGEGDLAQRALRWLPDLSRACLSRFEVILAHSSAAAAQLRKLGLPGDRITVTSRLRTGASPPPCPDSLLSEVTETLAGRPVWLATGVLAAETADLVTAHRDALRLLHRLLLVAIPRGPEDYDRLVEMLNATGLRHVTWSEGEAIDDNTQVLISCSPETLGLWYRVAPLSFLGSSLVPGARGLNPLDAAALGSAVLYGPQVDDHREAYSRLTAEGAARLVRDGAGLGQAVTRIIAPDQAARMALAGWQVVTEGAHLTDTLAELIHDRLDRREAPDADA